MTLTVGDPASGALGSSGPASRLVGRIERFASVGSTNDVVRGWLAAGEPEICVAVADEQTAGRGRDGRSWTAPAGAALLLSLGFRPAWLAPDRAWRLAAIVSLAMAEAAESTARLPGGTIRLKWPNDLVAEIGGSIRKLAGVLGETEGLGTSDPRAVVGIGINVDWLPDAFPAEIAPAMTSLRAMTGRSVDREGLLENFLARLEDHARPLRDDESLTSGHWIQRQVTTDRPVELHAPDGTVRRVFATGVDAETGALLVRDDDGDRPVFVGEIRHVRLSGL